MAHFLLIGLLAAPVAFAAEPTTRPAGAVAGKIIVDGEVPLSEMVVYLEPAEPSANAPENLPPVRISQRGAKFSPAMTVVSVGQTVEFVNDEDRLIEHNVFANSPAKRFDLGMYPPGQSRSVTFDKPGPVFLYCSIHRYMDGVVFVAPTPYHSLVSADGQYVITGVPDGKWTIKTWQRRRRFKEANQTVQIAGGETVKADLELKRR